MRNLEERNKRLTQELEQLRRGDQSAQTINEMQEYIEEVERKIDSCEKEIDDYKQENHYLKTTLEEKTVQLEAQARFEAEYDAQVGKMLEEKEELLLAKEKEQGVLV